jgi:hypothetical protein
MKRRHRRLLNIFALSLLAVAIYLNVYHVDDGYSVYKNSPVVKNSKQLSSKETGLSKLNNKEIHKN